MSLAEQVVLYQELARADSPRLDMFIVSLHHTRATLLAAGSDAQRQAHLPAILDGQVWCQGFSEPNAGSDLASLTTRAVRDGEHYVVNGQKVWSTMAHYADWCLLLARTDPAAPKRKGISYFLMDMHSDGVEVRPLRNSAGEWEFCEIFLTEVGVPAANLVGEEHDGWRVAQNTLGTERGTMVLEFAEHLRHGLDMLDDLCATSELASGLRAIDDPAIRETLAALHSEGHILGLLCDRVIDNLLRRGGAGPEASIIKLYYSELLRRVFTLAVEVDGLHAHLETRRPMGSACESGAWMLDFVLSWMWTIAAGTNEILLTIVAEHLHIDTQELRDVARRLLDAAGTVAAVRATAGVTDAALRVWRRIVDAGWTGIAIPEEFGAAGAGFAELAVVLVELGRAVAPGPYLGAVVLGHPASSLAGRSPSASTGSPAWRTARRSSPPPSPALPGGSEPLKPVRDSRRGQPGGGSMAARTTYLTYPAPTRSSSRPTSGTSRRWCSSVPASTPGLSWSRRPCST
jgi:alkylation response protein AidB-like acyl-CoA dehydrogenase